MTKDEALKLALEALQPTPYKDDLTVAKETSKAITAIKEALMSGTDGAQSESCEYCKGTGDVHSFDGEWRGVCVCKAGKALAQTEQEPEYKGWYCAHCQRGVDGSEVTYHEQHTVCGRVITDDLPPKTQPWEKFCDSNCVWTDHHPDCKLAEQSTECGEPVALETVYETIIHWDEGGGKRSRRELARRIVSLYTTPPQRPSRSDIKPLTDEEIWVLTSEYNDYDQHGEYFEAVYIGKPTSKQIQKHCHVTEQGAVHILNGGGRVKYEDQWYNLRKEKAAHGIKELKEYKK